MVLGWRTRRSTTKSHRATSEKKLPSPNGTLNMEQLVIPNHFLCPISLDLMKDPVTLSSGITYDRQSIDTWLESGNFKCPVTNQVLKSFDLIPNHTLRTMIQEWSFQNQRYGIQRVPTPRVPIMAADVSEILYSITAAARLVDQDSCLDNLKRITKWAEESERNKRCIVENGAASVLAYAFDAFACDDVSRQNGIVVCEEILSLLSWILAMLTSLDEETQTYLGSHASLGCMVWFLKSGRDVLVKQRSILALRKVLSCNNDQSKRAVEEMEEIERVSKTLFDFIKEKKSMTITKASLTIVFHLGSHSEKFKESFLEMGVVSLMLETILESEKGVTERALYLLDFLCDTKQGREQTYANALAIPVLVKNILRVSETATECSISALWKLCKNATREEEERVIVEALQVGAFQKLLLVLQVRCAGEYDNKDKATELLKLLNPYRGGLEYIESVDFKSIRRSF